MKSKMTASEVKFQYENNNADGKFFTRNNMKFAGDTMGNYGVRAQPVEIDTYTRGTVTCWELYRKQAVKCGLDSSAFFSVENFERIVAKA